MTDGWEGLAPANADDNQSSEIEALQKEIIRALDANPLLEKMLLRRVQANTYRPGRTHDEVAFLEGQRALAYSILHYAGRFNG